MVFTGYPIQRRIIDLSTYVHIHVCFACDQNEGVALLASAYLKRLAEEDANSPENRWWLFDAKMFLSSLADRTGSNLGPKGGLSLWGMIGKNTEVGQFCEGLRPFWADLLSDVEGGPCDFENVMVFEEVEQSQAATVYQIGWDDCESDQRAIIIKQLSRLPFFWNQH